MTAGSAALILTRACAAAALVVALLAPLPASAQSISEKMNDWLFGKPLKEQPGAVDAPEIDCPGVEVRQGASTMAISAPGAEASPMTMRYQVSIGRLARECAILGGVMTMKVGVQGRVLLGPAGGPGQVDIPMRIVVVQEGPEPKPVVGKFAKLSIAVPPGQTSVPYTHVEQDVTFPLPSPRALEAYVVYVGFDPSGGAPAKPERKAAKKQKRK